MDMQITIDVTDSLRGSAILSYAQLIHQHATGVPASHLELIFSLLQESLAGYCNEVTDLPGFDQHPYLIGQINLGITALHALIDELNIQAIRIHDLDNPPLHNPSNGAIL
jgi:hypothetical protein